MATNLETLVGIAILSLLVALVIVFWRMWRETRSKFTGGLALFAGILLLKQVLTMLQNFERARNLPVLGGRLQLLANVGEAIALGILLYVVAR